MGRYDDATGPRVWRLASGEFEVCGLRELSPVFRSRRAAERWLAAALERVPRRLRPQPRPCLCCGEVFFSDGPHNRLCDPCRRRGGPPDEMRRAAVLRRRSAP